MSKRTAWNLGPGRARHFIGRRAAFAELQKRLASGGPVCVSSQHGGMGGVGLNTFVREYIHRHTDMYSIAWTLPGQSRTSCASEYANLGRAIGITRSSQQEVIDATRNWLKANGRWVLVFEDVGDVSDVADFIPETEKGHVLVILRDPIPEFESSLNIGTLSADEAAKLLTSTSGVSDARSIGALIYHLGGVPLPLVLAGAYLRATKGSGSSDIVRVLTNASNGENGSSPDLSTKLLVHAVLEPALNRISAKMPAARDLLALCSFFGGAPVPLSLIVNGAEHYSSLLSETARDKDALHAAFAVLHRFGLIDITNERLVIHRLVQYVVRHGMSHDARKAWASAALRAVETAYPSLEVYSDADSEYASLVPHVLATSEHTEQAEAALGKTGLLLNRLGLNLRTCGALHDGLRYCERSLRVSESYYGEIHPSVAMRVNSLGILHQDLGELEKARACYERAIHICEKVYGPVGEAVFTSVHSSMLTMPVRNLCTVLDAMGDLTAAKKAYEQALAIHMQVHGRHHTIVAECANNLGNLCHKNDDYGSAQNYFEIAVEAEMNADTPVQGNLAIYLNNLGTLLLSEKRPTEAQEKFERALQLDRTDYGSQHPSVVQDLANLAQAFTAQRKFDEASEAFAEALAIAEGSAEPDTKRIQLLLRWLARVSHLRPDLAAARNYHERLIALKESLYGPDSPELFKVLFAYVGTLEKAGDLDRAVVALERVLAISARTPGDAEEETAQAHHVLGVVKLAMGLHKDALEHLETALQLHQRKDGDAGPEVAKDNYYIGLVQVAQGEAIMGVAHLNRALHLYEVAYGKDHTRTRRVRRKLSELNP